ncbi:MAG: hypothetical protein K6F88_05320 [Ruminococcus sp.]|nr:hypothetical protein [Ruminococcus sp.]
MDYFTMSQEYFRDADAIHKTMRKYEAKLSGCRKENLEKLNSTIASYRYIYYDLYNTAKLLLKRAQKIESKTEKEKENKDAA